MPKTNVNVFRVSTKVAEGQDERGKSLLERHENQDYRAPSQRDIQNRSATNGTCNSIIQKDVFFNNPRS